MANGTPLPFPRPVLPIILPLLGKVALLGVAQRHISVKFHPKQGGKKNANPLPINIQTIGEWIKVKRTERELTSGHVAAKMGIAHPLGSVAARRRQMQLNDPSRRSLWTSAEDQLLGTKPDSDIARQLQRTVSGVKNRREKLKIKACINPWQILVVFENAVVQKIGRLLNFY